MRASSLTTLTASGTGDDPAALVVTEIAADGFPGGPDTSGTAEAIDVGGRPGSVHPPSEDELPSMFEPDDTFEHVVHAGDRRLVATSSGVDQEAVIAVLDAWADRIDAGEPVRGDDLPLPEGMEAGVPRTKTWRSETVVTVIATNDATGASVGYQLAPPGPTPPSKPCSTATAPPSATSVFTVESTAPAPTRCSPSPAREGRSTSKGGEALARRTRPDPDTVTALARSLHEVDTADWRAALEQIDPAVEPDLLSAPTLFDPPLTG